MAIDLRQMTQKIHNDCKKLDKNKKTKLTNIISLGNTYVELVSKYLALYSPTNKKILEVVTDELFFDVHASVTLAIGGYYKSGCVLIRTAVEIGLYILFFIDHPVEVRMWSSKDENSPRNDMNFIQILDEIASIDYLRAASGRDVDLDLIKKEKESLMKNYRLLSERVHGKYKFLQNANTPEEQLDNFYTTGKGSFTSLIKLAVERAGNDINVNDSVPSLKKVK